MPNFGRYYLGYSSLRKMEMEMVLRILFIAAILGGGTVGGESQGSNHVRVLMLPQDFVWDNETHYAVLCQPGTQVLVILDQPPTREVFGYIDSSIHSCLLGSRPTEPI